MKDLWAMRMFVGLVIVMLVLVGCTNADRAYRSGRPLRSLNPTTVISTLEGHPKLKLDVLVEEYYQAGADQKAVRNTIIDVSMILIDQHHSLFLSKFSSFRKGFDSSMDIGSMATDAVATIVSPAMTKSILAAVSGAMTASKVTIDKNYFYDQTIQVLIKQMEVQRKTATVPLIGGTRKSIAEYPLSAALADIERYYFAGTLDGALAGVTRNADKQETEADKSIKNLLTDQRNDGLLVEEFLKQSGGDTQPLLTAAAQWLQSNSSAQDAVRSAAMVLAVERLSDADDTEAKELQTWITDMGTDYNKVFAYLSSEASRDDIIRFVSNIMQHGFELEVKAKN